jgi:hypothetical protein
MPSLAEGGEGIIYKLAEPPGQVLKHYLPKVLAGKGPMLAAKIHAMVSNPPEDPTVHLRHCSLAWPLSAVVDTAGAFAGYVMPAIDRESSVELHMVSNPSDRKRSQKAPPWLRGFTWEYLLRVATNLASATQALHDAGYVIGDFNERNVLVRKNALVSLVDCDSMQVPNPGGEPFLCSVYRQEFTAPELLLVNKSQQARTRESDRFPLAVHIYQLLMEGRHPFAGVWHGSGDKPELHKLATQGLFVQLGDRRLAPQAGTPPFGIFTRDIQQLFTRAFVNGATDPSARPDGLEWHRHLQRLAHTLVTCQHVEAHRYPRHLGTACPWCKLDKGSQVATAPRPSQVPLPPAVSPPWPQHAVSPALHPYQAANQYPTAPPAPTWNPGWAPPPSQPQWQQRPARPSRRRRRAWLLLLMVLGVVSWIAYAGSSRTPPAPISPSSITPGHATPKEAVDGFFQARFQGNETLACSYASPASRATCNSQNSQQPAITGNITIDDADVSGNFALVEVTGSLCYPGRACAGNTNPLLNMPASPASFQQVYDDLVKSTTYTFSPYPCIRVGGMWYYNNGP